MINNMRTIKETVCEKAGRAKRYMTELVKGLEDESGMGVVEIVLIIIVLVGLVILFKSKITALVNTLLSKMSTQAKQI